MTLAPAALATAGLLVASAARAHLAIGGRSLVGLCHLSSALVLGRAVAATAEAGAEVHEAHTTFLVEREIQGKGPLAGTRIELLGGPVPARYAAGEEALIFLTAGGAGDVARWTAVQRAGGRLVLRAGDALDAKEARTLAALCVAAHRGATQGEAGLATTAALIELLDARVEGVRLLAALDLLERAHHPDLFSPAARGRLTGPDPAGASDPRIRALVPSITQTLEAVRRPAPPRVAPRHDGQAMNPHGPAGAPEDE